MSRDCTREVLAFAFGDVDWASLSREFAEATGTTAGHVAAQRPRGALNPPGSVSVDASGRQRRSGGVA